MHSVQSNKDRTKKKKKRLLTLYSSICDFLSLVDSSFCVFFSFHQHHLGMLHIQVILCLCIYIKENNRGYDTATCSGVSWGRLTDLQ